MYRVRLNANLTDANFRRSIILPKCRFGLMPLGAILEPEMTHELDGGD
jgi:hypothetical protein